MITKYITEKEQIPSSILWNELSTPEKKTVMHKDHRYTVLFAQEESGFSYYGRIVLGTILSVFSFGIALFFESIRDLFANKKTREFAVPDPSPAMTAVAQFVANCLDTDKTTTNEQAFIEITNNYSFLDSLLQSYIQAKNPDTSTKQQQKEFKKFLYSEISQVQAGITELTKRATDILNRLTDEKTSSTPAPKELISDLTQCNALHSQILELGNSCTRSLTTIASQAKQIQSTPVTGIQNVGNTCYIIAAMQALFAIDNLQDLVPNAITQNPDELPEKFASRSAIFNSFKTLLEAKKRFANAKELGNLVGAMRLIIFNARLDEGGFDINTQRINSYQDAGSFFELLLYVIGKVFTLSHKQTYVTQKNTTRKKLEITSGGALLLSEESGSMQEKLIAYTQIREQRLAPSKTAAINTDNIVLIRESFRIIGEPPELLVFRVHPYRVDPKKDQVIDCACLFVNQLNTTYSLTGFLQNHDQIHWTSIVYNDKKWCECNDSTIKEITTQDRSFQTEANYLVYKRLHVTVS